MNANIRTIGGSIGAAVMASIVTAQLAPNGLPKESGYTSGFAVMAGGLVLAALAGLLIPSARASCGDGERAASTPSWRMVAGPARSSATRRANEQPGRPGPEGGCGATRVRNQQRILDSAPGRCSASPVPTPASRRSRRGPASAWAPSTGVSPARTR